MVSFGEEREVIPYIVAEGRKGAGTNSGKSVQ